MGHTAKIRHQRRRRAIRSGAWAEMVEKRQTERTHRWIEARFMFTQAREKTKAEKILFNAHVAALRAAKARK